VKDVNSRWNVARITTAHHQPSAEKESAVNQNARTYVLHRIADLTQTARQQPIGNLAASVVKDSLNKAELAYASASDVKPKQTAHPTPSAMVEIANQPANLTWNAPMLRLALTVAVSILV
jgi:hypothetical protein